MLILSDRGVSGETGALPLCWLSLQCINILSVREPHPVFHHCRDWEAREVAHFALLIGYGASAITPYLAYESIEALLDEGAYVPDGLTFERRRKITLTRSRRAS